MRVVTWDGKSVSKAYEGGGLVPNSCCARNTAHMRDICHDAHNAGMI